MSEPSVTRNTVLAYLDGLSDDAAAHIYPSDLEKCMTSECVVEVVSVRAGNGDESTVPLFSREQVVAALAAAPAQSGVRQFTDDERQFTKKPVTIQAIQWTGRNLREVIAFTDGPPDTRSAHAGMAWDAYVDLVARDGLKIYTLEGKMSAAVGDWIIKGVQGEHYPCKPDIFEATYSRAALAAPAQPINTVWPNCVDANLIGSPSTSHPAIGEPPAQQPWQYTPPAQERIQALELEVRQLTEQIAELRHAPTTQADSQPAQVLVYPPLPEPFIGVKNQPWVGHAEVIRSAIGEDGVIPCFTAGQMVAYADATHAARAQADSVLEDAARYQWIRGPGEESTRYSRWSIEYWDGQNGWQPMQRERMDSAIDAARKQGANHD